MTSATYESSAFHFPHAAGDTQYRLANAHVCQQVRQVGIVLFDGFSLLGAGFIAEAFQQANQLAAYGGSQGRVEYQVHLLSFSGGVVRCGARRRLRSVPNALISVNMAVPTHCSLQTARLSVMPSMRLRG